MTKQITRVEQQSRTLRLSLLLLVGLLAGIIPETHAQITIGASGGANVEQFQPFSLNRGYSRDASIYTASELNTLTTGGTITTLAWNSSNGGNFAPVKIYLKEAGTAMQVVSDTWDNTIVGATLVYNNTPPNAVDGWNTIDITDFPIAANQNLMVLIESNTGGSGLNPIAVAVPRFTYTHTGSDMHGYRTMNNTPPNTQPLLPDNKRPDIKIGGLSTPSCAMPGGMYVSGITGNMANVNVYPPPSVPTSYDYYLSTGNTAPDALTMPTGNVSANTTGTTTINLTNLGYTTEYHVWVRSRCSNTDVSNWSNFMSFTTYAAPPTNDECANATTLTVNTDLNCTTTITASTISSTQSADPLGGNVTYPNGINDDIWYEFTATATVHKISMQVESGDAGELELYNGSCGALTYMNSVSGNYFEEMEATGLTIGNVYKIRVYSASSNQGVYGSYTLCVKTIPPPPVNDACANAATLTVNSAPGCASSMAGTTVSATQSNETPSTQNPGGTDDDVWYQFTATSGSHRITLTNFTDYMTMALYSGSCGSLIHIQETSSGYEDTSLILDVAGLTAGVIYKIRVFTSEGAPEYTSAFNICVGPPPPPPGNDDCANAALLTANTTGNGCNITQSGTTLAATQSSETTSPDQNGSGTNDDVWYKFTASDTAYRITLSDITGNTADMEMAIYSGACGSLVFKASSFLPTMDVYGLTPGQEYKVRVYTFNANADYANFNICLRTVPPPNDEASGAIVLTVGAGCTGNPYDNSDATQSAGEPYPSCVDGWEIGLAGMWYKFVAPTSGMVKIACDDNGTMGDSRLALFSTTNADDYSLFNIIACDNNNGVVAANRSLLYATGLTAGNTYYINIDYLINFSDPSATIKGTYCVTVDEMSTAMLSTTAGDCEAGQATSDINSGYHNWMSLVDNEGNLIANVRQLSGTATSFSASTTVKNGMARTDADGTPYMNRNFLINGAGATSADVQVFFTNDELTNLGSAIGNLNITRVTGTACAADFVYNAGTNTFLAQTANSSNNGINYIRFNTPGFSNFYIMSGNVPLPLKLVSFDGKNEGRANLLRWETADEKNCSHFELQRSDDGVHFTSLTEIKAKNISGSNVYDYRDLHPLKGKNFYRLSMQEKDGKAMISDVVILRSEEAGNIAVSLTPNPVNEVLKIVVKGNMGRYAAIQVTDITGRVVKTELLGSPTTVVDMSNLADGIYIVKYMDGATSFVSKIVKQ